MEDVKYWDVIIVGAGAAGLMAAKQLSSAGKSVAVFEARNYIGGRAYTIIDDRFSVNPELGAEFIHGDLPLTFELIKEADIKYYKTSGEAWRNENGILKKQEGFIEDESELEGKFKALKEDITVTAFFDRYLKDDRYYELKKSLKSYVEGYYAADASNTSTYALRDELTNADEGQYRIESGYKTLIGYLYKQCRQCGCTFYVSSKISEIQWQKDEVHILASNGKFSSKKIIVTVPLGVLQAKDDSESYIRFAPAIPDKLAAAKELGFGSVIKILFQFNHAFWKENGREKLGFVFSDEAVPTWWTQYPKEGNLLTGWLAGPKADLLKDKSNEEIKQLALASLAAIFKKDTEDIFHNLRAYHIVNWITDACSYGAYAYESVNAPMFRNILKQPVADTLFFAGEALHAGPEIGTVEAALCSGKETAEIVLSHL